MLFSEAKLCQPKLIILLFSSGFTPLHWSAHYGCLDPIFCSSAALMWERRTKCIARRRRYCRCFYYAKLCLRKLILLLFCRQRTPLHMSAVTAQFVTRGGLEVSRLLVESNADVSARDKCLPPPPPPISPSSHNLYVVCSYGNTALEMAIERNQIVVATFLCSIRAPQ